MTMMRPNSRRRERQSGVTIILLSLMLCTVLLPMVGLAFDLTMLYIVKAKLSGAVDAGVLAAGRSLVGSKTLAAQQTQVTNIAIDFLNANMPQGYWGTTAIPTITTATTDIVKQDPVNMRILITLRATVTVPLTFLNFLQTNATVAASAAASRRYLRMVILLDRSSSMSGDPIAELKLAVSDSNPSDSGYPGFVQDFFEGQDDLGMVVFGGSALVAYPPRDPLNPTAGHGPDPNFKTIDPSNLQVEVPLLQAGSNTGTAEGLILAYKELTKNPQPLYYNVIVLFTDGQPNGFTAGWNGASPPALYAGDALDYNTTTAAALSGGTTCKYKNYTDFNPNGNQMIGWMAQWGGYANSNGYGHGIYGSMQNTPHSSGTAGNPAADVQAWLADAGGDSSIYASHHDTCGYVTTGTVDADVASFPTADYYGNRLIGPEPLGTDYKASYEYHLKGNVNLVSTAVTNAYQIGNVSWNAANQAAWRIRHDKTLNPVIFCIGYHGGDDIDKGFLKRVANPDTGYAQWGSGGPYPQDQYGQYLPSDYDPTSTTGSYYDASAGSIALAFQEVKSAILSLAM